MSGFEFIDSNHSNQFVKYYLHLYRLNKERNDDTVRDYECTLRCGARLILFKDHDDEWAIKSSERANHIHGPQTDKENKQVRNLCKEKIAIQPTIPTPKIFDQVRLELSPSSSSPDKKALPAYINVQKAMSNKRRKCLFPSGIPIYDIDFALQILEDGWTQTLNEQYFVMAEKVIERYVVFATQPFLRHLCTSPVVYMDGTFKSCPDIFAQLYTLHCVVKDYVFPAAFALLPNKNEATYRNLFDIMVDICNDSGATFHPASFLVDFEKAMIIAIKHVFPFADIKGCLFHFGQCIWRHDQSTGLADSYTGDFRTLVRRLTALALVPLDQLDGLFRRVQIKFIAKTLATPQILKFLDYFKDTWLYDGSALFDRSLWNHFNYMGRRTNNNLEGWHFALNRRFNLANPNVFEFITFLKHEHHKQDCDLTIALNGSKLKYKNRVYAEIHDTLENFKVTALNKELDWFDFLDHVAVLMHHSA